ncbi:MAG: VCBS repeat-containing protein [Methanomassiliicoccales archaeon]|nr:MAG: VCBS repeat-containing protein [Methanomassiliicoccales archaeon]
MREKVRKKLVWDDHGVSEIIADILILAMTVVLFAIIFAFVWSLPAPDEATYADFDGNVQLTTDGAHINMTHISGEDLHSGYTRIYLFKNIGTSGVVSRELLTQGTDDDNPAPGGYGLADDETWSTGEKWSYYFKGVGAADDLEIRILDTKTQTLIMGAKLLGVGVNDAPIIMDRWYSPSPAVNATNLTIYVRVKDPDGFDDISASGSVYSNVSALNRTYVFRNFDWISHTEDTGVFETNLTVDQGQGIYILTINAKDSSGLIDRSRMRIDVSYTALNAPKILERWSIPEVGVNGTDITIYARVEDPDGIDTLEYVTMDATELGLGSVVQMYDNESDGIFEYTFKINVSSGRSYTVNFTARDITNLTDSAHQNISVKRFNPVISRMWTVPTTGKDQENITVYWEVSDPDGLNDLKDVYIRPYHLNNSYDWVRLDPVTDDPEEDGIFNFTLKINVTTGGGNKTISFKARDMEGNDVTTQMQVFVYTRFSPVILSRWTDPIVLDNNTEVTIYANVMDPDGYEDINYSGAVQVNVGDLDQNLSYSDAWVNLTDPDYDGTFYCITLINQSEGSHILEFRATDKSGNNVTAFLNVTIQPYMPRFLNVWTSPSIGKNGSEILIYANVMDPNGYNDIYNVTVDIVQLNQTLNQSQPMYVEMIDVNRNGTFLNTTLININVTGIYSLNFTVRDQSGNVATTNLQLLVTSHKPAIVSAWYTPDPAINGTNVMIHAWIFDDDGYEDIVVVRANVSALDTFSGNVTWINLTDSDSDGIYENYTLVNVNVSGDYLVNLEVFDQSGNHYTKDLNVTVVLAAETYEEDMVFFADVTPNAVASQDNVYFSAIGKNGTGFDKQIWEVKFELKSDDYWEPTKVGTYTLDRVFDWWFKYPTFIEAPGTSTSNLDSKVYFTAYNQTGHAIAWHNITLSVLFDQSGGPVTEGTALEQNVAWISHDQGFVITNNKTSNEMIQVFDASRDEYAQIWVKIGSNKITNTEKANVWQLRSQSTGEVVADFSSPNYKFAYDGVLAGYWFFVLDINTGELYDWMMEEDDIPELGDGTKSEYFDVYMKIKDTTDDFFSTTSWIVVHGGTEGFAAKLIAYYDPDYVPGEDPLVDDGNGDGFPDDLVRADAGTDDPQDDYIFNSTEIVYFLIEMIDYNDPSPPPDYADFSQFELIDFTGNRRISSAEGQGPVGEIDRNEYYSGDPYMFAVDLLRADKDPWLVGPSAYTAMVKNMADNNEYGESGYAIIVRNIEVNSPTSIMDVVSGRDMVGTGNNPPRYYGDFYENQGGATWEIQAYAYRDGTSGNKDPYGIIYSVEFEDLDNDDDKDIVVVLEGGTETPGVVMFDNDGSWTRSDIYMGVTLYSIAAGDLDGDGDLDIAASGPYGQAQNPPGITYVFENEGAAEFSAPVTYSTGDVSMNHDHATVIGDLDGDYDDGDYVKWGDVVVGSNAGLQRISYSGGIWSVTTIQSSRDYTSVDIADVDGDGDLDIVAADDEGDVYLFTQNGLGSLTFTESEVVTFTGQAVLAEVAFGDIDGEGDLDVVIGRGSYLYSFESDGTQINSNSDFNPTLLTGNIVSLQVGNIDGAIQDDVMIATDDGFVYHYRNLGKATDWLRFQVDYLTGRLGGSAEFYSIAIGDANLGGA